MRRSWLPVVVAVVLMEVIASSALASLSIVADLDSNATNGPDSLVIEPTDTLLVRLWFVGSDSILSYGVTLGDTTGALAWVPESTSTIYNSPSGWADIPVYQDSLGWLLLQATDFSGQTPIQVPYEFARLKFTVAAGDSCGTLLGDLDLSGWFNPDLGENSFTGFEGLTVCVTEVLDGGGDAPDQPGGEGGGGFDNATAECETLPCCDYVEDKPETGRVWVVNDDGTIGTDCDCNDIQACIDSAVAGDTVCVNPGSYTQLLTLPHSLADEPKNRYYSTRAAFTILKDDIVVKSSAGASVTFVGNDSDTEPHVCALLGDTLEVLEDVVVAGFTMHGGRTAGIYPGQAWGAGALLCTEKVMSSVTIRGNVFENNVGPHGAAIRLHGGEPCITGNTFIHNRLTSDAQSVAQGAAIQVTKPTFQIAPAITGNRFYANDREPGVIVLGGAISFEGAAGIVRGNVFESCSATEGGAIYLAGSPAHPVIEYNVFSSCDADSFGGAISTYHGSGVIAPVIQSNTFVLNHAPTGRGGAIYSENPDMVVDITQNIFAYSRGGAIVLQDIPASEIEAFSCNDFYANVGGDVYGIPESLWSDIVFEDPVFCSGTSSCSLWSISAESPCAPGAACDSLIGAAGTCESCTMIATGVDAIDGAEGSARPLEVSVAPNPFNSTVEITYWNEGPGRGAEVNIFDVRGRMVYHFPVCSGSKGWARVVWDGSSAKGGAASGCYFVVVRSKGRTFVGKVMLLR